eukprot:15469153-Alexandrium_andersonii.AAC.1
MARARARACVCVRVYARARASNTLVATVRHVARACIRIRSCTHEGSHPRVGACMLAHGLAHARARTRVSMCVRVRLIPRGPPRRS